MLCEMNMLRDVRDGGTKVQPDFLSAFKAHISSVNSKLAEAGRCCGEHPSLIHNNQEL